MFVHDVKHKRKQHPECHRVIARLSTGMKNNYNEVDMHLYLFLIFIQYYGNYTDGTFVRADSNKALLQ